MANGVAGLRTTDVSLSFQGRIETASELVRGNVTIKQLEKRAGHVVSDAQTAGKPFDPSGPATRYN